MVTPFGSRSVKLVVGSLLVNVGSYLVDNKNHLETVSVVRISLVCSQMSCPDGVESPPVIGAITLVDLYIHNRQVRYLFLIFFLVQVVMMWVPMMVDPQVGQE